MAAAVSLSLAPVGEISNISNFSRKSWPPHLYFSSFLFYTNKPQGQVKICLPSSFIFFSKLLVAWRIPEWVNVTGHQMGWSGDGVCQCRAPMSCINMDSYLLLLMPWGTCLEAVDRSRRIYLPQLGGGWAAKKNKKWEGVLTNLQRSVGRGTWNGGWRKGQKFGHLWALFIINSSINEPKKTHKNTERTKRCRIEKKQYRGGGA